MCFGHACGITPRKRHAQAREPTAVQVMSPSYGSLDGSSVGLPADMSTFPWACETSGSKVVKTGGVGGCVGEHGTPRGVQLACLGSSKTL